MTRTICFIDTESTGVNEPDERIIEFCGMTFNLDTEEHIVTNTWRIRPDVKIKPKAQKVHGISMADLENEPTWDAVAPLIADVCNPAYASVAHNGLFFDFPFIQRECARLGIHVNFGIRFDTMTNARWATHNGKNPKLGELAHCLGVPYDPEQAHGAEYDVDVMAQCFFEGRRLGYFSLD